MYVFLIAGKKITNFSRTYIDRSSAKRIFESVRPAGDKRPVRGSLTNHLVGFHRHEARAAGSPSSRGEKTAEERRRRRRSSTTEGTRLLVFARLPNDGQRSPWLLTAVSAPAIIDFYNFPCPPLSGLPIPQLAHTSSKNITSSLSSLLSPSWHIFLCENSSGYWI